MSKMHLIGNAHIDPVWLWRWQDGYTEVLNTWRSVLDRMKEFPELKFTSACAVYYQWVEKTDPEMFREIQERVKEGRWCITGGWFLQPDCNIPSGESFARHALISQHYFKDKFGVKATSGYNVDSFGHNASLPMILSASGMKNYVFMRPGTHENDRLYDLFRWESADGSAVTTYRIPCTYCITPSKLDSLDEISGRTSDGTPRMAFIGIGNHGGGPSIELLDKINSLGLQDTEYSTVNEYFSEVEGEQMPTVKDELQHHAIGCYSAEQPVKAQNRRCEENLILAERLSVMASELVGTKYPHGKLNRGWRNVLFNQFHDIMGGCSIESAYSDAYYLYGETMSITEQIINSAMVAIARRVDTLKGCELPAYKATGSTFMIWNHESIGTPVIVFNPHAHKVRGEVKITTRARRVEDEHGNLIPHQAIRGEQTNCASKHASVFLAEVEPFGYAVYRIFVETDEAYVPVGVKTTEHSLENSRLLVEFDKATGEIASIYDKAQEKYILDKPCSTVLLDETDCDTWAHSKDKLGETVGAFGNPTFKVKESGAVRGVLEVISTFGNSTITRKYKLVTDSEMLSVDTEIDFHEKHRAIKLAFPKGADGKVDASIPYGTIERSTVGYEDPFGKWLATGDIAITTDSLYGYDTDGGNVRITALRGAIYADHYGERDEECRYMSMGLTRLSYAIYPRGSHLRNYELADEFDCPMRALVTGFTHGVLPERKSCIEHSDGIHITAIKRSEYRDGNIVRFFETEGENRTAEITLFGKKVSTDITHHSLVTLSDDGTRLNLLEEEI